MLEFDTPYYVSRSIWLMILQMGQESCKAHVIVCVQTLVSLCVYIYIYIRLSFSRFLEGNDAAFNAQLGVKYL